MLDKIKNKYHEYYIKRIIEEFGNKVNVDLSEVKVSIVPVVERIGVKACALCDYEIDEYSREVLKTWNYEIRVAEEIVSGIMEEDIIKNIIGHEVAHILLYMENNLEAGHKRDFIIKCLKLGVRRDYANSNPEIQVQGNPKTLKKYGYKKVVCKCCGKVIERTNSNTRVRNLIKNFKCSACGGELGFKRY